MPISEKHLRIPALYLMSLKPDGFIQTTVLIAELEDLFAPEGRDAEILAGRNDTYFSQRVRNLVSHKNNTTGLEYRGLAIHIKEREGWQITDAGRDLIAQIYD